MFNFIQMAVQTLNVLRSWCFNDPKLSRRCLALVSYDSQCEEVTPELYHAYCDKHYALLKTGCENYHLIGDAFLESHDRLVSYLTNSDPDLNDHLEALRIIFKLQYTSIEELCLRKDHREIFQIVDNWAHRDFNFKLGGFAGGLFDVSKDLKTGKRRVICCHKIDNIFTYLVNKIKLSIRRDSARS